MPTWQLDDCAARGGEGDACDDELLPRVGFIVTTLEWDNRAVVRCYNKRGTAEQWISAGMEAVTRTWLSCHRFQANEVRLWLRVTASNAGNLWRPPAVPRRVDTTWSLASLQQRLIRWLFAAIPRRLEGLPRRAGQRPPRGLASGTAPKIGGPAKGPKIADERRSLRSQCHPGNANGPSGAPNPIRLNSEQRVHVVRNEWGESSMEIRGLTRISRPRCAAPGHVTREGQPSDR